MPLTTLDPNTALIVVDLQQGTASHAFLRPLPQVVERTRALLHAFRAAALPVVLVNVAGRAPGRTEQGPRSQLNLSADWTDLLPALDRHPDDLTVTKRSWGAFATTDLEQQLRARAVTQVVITGLVTSGGVEAPARQAYELGFHVTLALDAMTDLRDEAQRHTLTHVFPRLAKTGSADDIIALLQHRSVPA